ncbi:hypothetical protein K8R33_00920 [archaeon]|nr:hypothetical protein [archaeon]
MKKALELRKKLKAKKPTFLRSDSNRGKYKNKWRKPRGIHNKRRLKFAGHQKNPSQGFRSPKEVRGLHTSGLELITIKNIKDLHKIDIKTQIAELSSTLGLRNKLIILEECKSKKIPILNIKDIDKFIKESREKIETKKKVKQKKTKDKEKSKKEAIKKAEEKKAEKNKEEKQEKVKEDVLKAKPQTQEAQKQIIPKQKDTAQAKAGHQASSVPGTKQ